METLNDYICDRMVCRCPVSSLCALAISSKSIAGVERSTSALASTLDKAFVAAFSEPLTCLISEVNWEMKLR